MALTDTYRRRLHDQALDQYGYVTTRDAAELAVPAVELRKLAQRGGLDRLAYGLYRFDAVLALHDLGLANPRRIRVGIPRRARPRLPASVEIVQRHLEPVDLTTYEGIPSTTVARALLDCRDLIMIDRLIDAVEEAARRGLLTRRDARRVLAELGAAA
jgi:predicted transcriptional regulator of viral defense system